MKIETKFIGEVEITEKDIITFETGLPAFEDERQFVVLPLGEGTSFFTLQSINTVAVSFIIANPFDFFSDYHVKIPDNLIETLEIENKEDVAIFSILTVQDPFSQTTANLQAPVIINTKKQKGKQLVMPESGYLPKHYLFPKQPSTVGEGK